MSNKTLFLARFWQILNPLKVLGITNKDLRAGAVCDIFLKRWESFTVTWNPSFFRTWQIFMHFLFLQSSWLLNNISCLPWDLPYAFYMCKRTSKTISYHWGISKLPYSRQNQCDQLRANYLHNPWNVHRGTQRHDAAKCVVSVKQQYDGTTFAKGLKCKWVWLDVNVFAWYRKESSLWWSWIQINNDTPIIIGG